MKIRCAEKNGDIKTLIDIGRLSFPDSLQWCGPKRWAGKMWEFIIASRFNEVWLCQLGSQAGGFILLVTDVEQYKKEKRKLRPGIGTLLYASAMHPWLVITKIIEKIFSANAASLIYADVDNLKSTTGKSIWVEPIAVLPGMRGKGLGTGMMNFCEQRAIELGFDSVKLSVKIKNKSAVRLYEKSGFVITAKNKNYNFYVKALPRNPG